MNIKRILIIIFLVIGSVGGYFVYQYIQNVNYEKIDVKIGYWEDEEEETSEEAEAGGEVGGKTVEGEVIKRENVIGSEEEQTEVVEETKIVIHIAG